MNSVKLVFVKNGFIPLLSNLTSEEKGKWGKMNGQQMVEHITTLFMFSSGRIKTTIITSEENLPKFREFLMSDKEFRENTKAPGDILPDEPLPLRNPNITEALHVLEKSVQEFIDFFDDDEDKKSVNPVFGDLNFSEWIQFHHKHLTHHLKQFGILK